jgi:hypothetical protein
VKINAGENSWLIARTDRDAADEAVAVASVGAALSKWLQHASPAGLRGIFQTLAASPAGGRFVIGAARPVLVTIARERPPTPEGLVVSGKLEEGMLPRRVRAVRPWYLSCVFEWHGGVTYLPWCSHVTPPLGSESANELDLDWLLLATHEVRK